MITTELALRVGLVSMLLLAGAFGLFEWTLLQGMHLDTARTVAVNMFVFGELFYLLNCRSLRYSMFRLGVFSNRWLVLGVVIMTLLQVLFTYSTAMNQLFGSAPMGHVEWLWVLGGSLAIYAVVGMEKWLRCCAGAGNGQVSRHQ